MSLVPEPSQKGFMLKTDGRWLPGQFVPGRYRIWNAQHAIHNAQHAVHHMRHTLRITQRAIRDMQLNTRSTRHATHTLTQHTHAHTHTHTRYNKYAAANACYAKCNAKLASHIMQCTICKIQQPLHTMHHEPRSP